MRLKLKYDEPLLNFAFKFNLCRSIKAMSMPYSEAVVKVGTDG
jgi:hypothetical protein